jgi:glycosyltransferase involved in cell wall biosynthesis
MNVLFVSHCYPWTLRSGTSQRIFHLVKGFAERHHVTLVALHRFAEPPEPGFPLRDRVRTIEVLDPTVEDTIEGCGRREHLRALVSSPLPLLVQLWHSRKLLRVLRDLKAENNFDVTWVERFSMAEIARQAGFGRIVVDLDDLESLLQLQQVRNSPSFRPLALAELGKLYLYERMLPRRFWRLVVCKQEDRRFFGRRDQQVFVVPNGTKVVATTPKDRERPGEICFIGSLGYGPNAEGAIYFHHEVLPKLLTLRPDVRFVVVGMNAPAQVIALHDGRTCAVADSVPDVARYLEAATLVVVPLLRGSGTKLKVLEALAHGKAVVSTSVGAEGLDLRPGVDLEIADDAESFARACARLLDDPEARCRMANAGRERVLSRYAWEQVCKSAEQAIAP